MPRTPSPLLTAQNHAKHVFHSLNRATPTDVRQVCLPLMALLVSQGQRSLSSVFAPSTLIGRDAGRLASSRPVTRGNGVDRRGAGDGENVYCVSTNKV